ncbi:MAG: DNA mismatch repair protein MutS [Chloroflexi bacterium]|nr:DNA mismatch repair protein MutS [Chloroflexota bacterium]
MTTPARKQYLDIKKQHPGEILLFRMGDFYETFDDDARTIACELEIALTTREMGKGNRIPLAGIPYHALDPYLARLIKKGYKVAICEQTSDPAASKGLVDREVVRVVTPGTVIEDSILDKTANNYLASVITDGDNAGLAYVDITTSEFATAQFPLANLPNELSRLNPAELLVSQDADPIESPKDTVVTSIEPPAFHPDFSRERLLEHFRVKSLEAFGCQGLPLAVRAAGAVLHYLEGKQKAALGQITALYTYSTTSYMPLDLQTRRNLELFEGGRWGDTRVSLLSVLDHTRTPMGGRLLRRWLGQPLLQLDTLLERQDGVEWFHRSTLRRGRVQAELQNVADLERLINRIRGFTASPRDLVSLGIGLASVPHLKDILKEDEDASKVATLERSLRVCQDIIALIGNAVVDDPPANISHGGGIKPGFSPELDDIRNASKSARDYIASLEAREREATGIKNLKVGFNKVFGYYIEISKSQAENAPEHYIRRQTLVGGERFITPEMKEYESRVLTAQDRILELEIALFRQVCQQIAESAGIILETAAAIAEVDVLASLGEVASRNNYVRPELNEGDTIDIKHGRHPVVERMLSSGSFVPNDTRLSNQDDQLVILTGPNMAGKSTFIRQVAIIVLMAQIGSFVPAESATIGIVDRIFTRVGLQDDVAVGQSTFMVEMVETAAILNHATSRSLIILDEIGRGTSTYDGLAIARATAEYIHNHPRLGCKTLFATHYHELTKLADALPRVTNWSVAVAEDKGEVVFLHRIVPGGADKSYGVHVARLAGLPSSVIHRAWEVLKDLENGAGPRSRGKGKKDGQPPPDQLPLLPTPSPITEEVLGLDVASMTPLEAITKLYELQEKAREDKG